MTMADCKVGGAFLSKCKNVPKSSDPYLHRKADVLNLAFSHLAFYKKHGMFTSQWVSFPTTNNYNFQSYAKEEFYQSKDCTNAT